MDVLSCALLPSSCVLCGSPLPQLDSAPICDVCWTEFPVQTEFPAQSGSACSRCGDTLAMPSAASNGLCRACRMAPPPFVRAVAYGLYQDRMKAAIHALKYDRLHPAARRLGEMLAVAIGQLELEAPLEMLVVPIPLHRSKYAERGFNQARSLAVHALESLKKTHPQWRLTLASSTLMRLRPTESQAGLSPRARRVNVRGAFSVSNPAEVIGRHILLIDDIFTTGATARSAATALTKAGALSVFVATLARARLLNQIGMGQRQAESSAWKNTPENWPGATMQQESVYSSQDQPSFE